MRLSWSLALVVAAVLLGGVAVAEEPWTAPDAATKKTNPIASDATSIAAGKAIFEKECLSCHGPAGKGDGPAAEALDKPPRDL